MTSYWEDTSWDPPGTDFSDFLHVGEDDVMLSLVQYPPAFGEVGVHAWVLHEVIDEDIQTT